MSTTRFLVTFLINGSLTDVDSAVFADADSPTYGVRRTDTLASVVASGTPLSRLSLGTYYKDVTDPAPDLTYQWAVRWVRAGNANVYGYFTTRGTANTTPVSVLFTWDQFVNKYGLVNIIQASNKDATQNTGSGTSAIPSGQPNWYAVQDAFNYATDEIFGNLMGGVLNVPLDFTPNGGVVPSRIGRLAMTLAWSEIYFARGRGDAKSSKNRLGDTYKDEQQAVYVTLAMMKAGSLQVREAVQAGDTTPSAVTVKDVLRARGACRYVDGQFLFTWT